MKHYIFKRLWGTIPTLIGVLILVFILFRVVGGDPAVTLLGKNASAEEIALLRHELGLDLSWSKQLYRSLKEAFEFDFGISWSTKTEVWPIIRSGLLPSLSLTLPAFIIATLLSLFLAALVSFFRGTYLDKGTLFLCIALMSIPSLSYILFFQNIFAFKLGLFEISGYEFGFPHFIPYVLLPGLIWVILSVGPDLRFYRSAFLEELYQDYVRTARSKGLSEYRILFYHVFKNALVPTLTYLLIQMPNIILGALLLENFFSIPGIGAVVVNALNTSDFPMIKAITILSAYAYIFFNLLTDILYHLIDPRVNLK